MQRVVYALGRALPRGTRLRFGLAEILGEWGKTLRILSQVR
jgi:hypothetical protein